MRQREHGDIEEQDRASSPFCGCPALESEVKGTARLGSPCRNTDRPVRPHTLRPASHLKVPSSSIQQRQARDLSAWMLPLWSQDSL